MQRDNPDKADIELRRIPRTDALLAQAVFVEAAGRCGREQVKRAIHAAQAQARARDIAPDQVADHALAALDTADLAGTTLRPIINATGVVIHTNLGRAPLSEQARAALHVASGYVDLEYDRSSGSRGERGHGTRVALLEAVPGAQDILVVNNGAAALLLAAVALAPNADVVVSRGEVIEIGDGFRLMELVAAGGVRIVEVGTTNRTTLADYAAALGPATGAILKVHPSNFVMSGFVSTVALPELTSLGIPVIADIGSGLLAPDPVLPAEPDAASVLAAGATLVTCSADKLLGGPQAGLLMGRAEEVARCRRHPLARAVRADKLTLAALEATLRGPRPPAYRFLHADPAHLRARTQTLTERLSVLGAELVSADGEVGGGGGPGVALPGWAVALPTAYAQRLRRGDPSVVARVHRGRCLIDLRCVEPGDDPRLAAAVLALADVTKPSRN